MKKKDFVIFYMILGYQKHLLSVGTAAGMHAAQQALLLLLSILKN